MDLYNRREGQEKRGITYSLWKLFGAIQVLHFDDENVGFGIKPKLESFSRDAAGTHASEGGQAFVTASTGVLQQNGEFGAGIELGGSVDDDEAYLQYGGLTGAPFTINGTANADSRQDLVLECGFRPSSVTDSDQTFFVGLAKAGEAVTGFLASGVPKDTDYVGFLVSELDGDKIQFTYRANGETAVTVDLLDGITAGNWYHVTLRYDSIQGRLIPGYASGDRSTIKWQEDFDNAVDQATIVSSAFPNAVQMAPIVASQMASTNNSAVDVRLLAVGQKSGPAE